MDLKFALLADHVNRTSEGKLNIIGEFNAISAARVPATHSSLFLVARFEASVSEGTEHQLTIGLYDEDGKGVLPKSPTFPIKFVPQGRGLPLRAQVVAQLGGLKFDHFGNFEFHLLVNGRIEATVPVSVSQIKEQKKRGKS